MSALRLELFAISRRLTWCSITGRSWNLQPNRYICNIIQLLNLQAFKAPVSLLPSRLQAIHLDRASTPYHPLRFFRTNLLLVKPAFTNWSHIL